MANWRAKYRFVDGVPCLDIRLKGIHNLFDNRDPSAHFERDLDQDAWDYLMGLAEDLPPRHAFRIGLWFEEPVSEQVPDAVIEQALRTHIGFELLRVERATLRQLRHGRTMLFVGLLILGLSLVVAELAAPNPTEAIGRLLREGVLIIGWIALWRPLESFFYDWLPFVQKRRLLRRMASAPVDIHHK